MTSPASFDSAPEPDADPPIYDRIGGREALETVVDLVACHLTDALTGAGVPSELVAEIIAAVSPLAAEIASNP
ncbi:hypothetical protein [Nocardia carnea]|uniref:hypothetical protein n=1 Tax=Nocardia carnea TaxID=37328 RepID=UPI00245631A6|nr:hypothetical protein [Nocardia carnea]